MVIWYETGHITDDGFLDTSFAIGERISPIGVALALVLYMGTEAIRMLAEIFLRQREEMGRIKGRAQVVEELEVASLEEAKELIRQARETIDVERKRQNGVG